jgi:prepilin-type N-terminal cleavage/methylation domain-containing protein
VRADRTAGFTLVELLVSMAVLALVALVMVSGLRFAVRAVASTDDRREAMEELTLGLSVLRGELERAEPMMVKAGNRDLVLFSGYGDRVRFANVEPPYFAGAPYLAYEYAITPDRGAYAIELRRAPIDPDEPDLAVVEAADARTILRVPGELRFSYWGSLGPREAPAWHAEWPVGPRLPDAIRLAQSDDPGWPDLVVPMRITAPWYCGGAGAAAGTSGADSETGADGDAIGDGDAVGGDQPGGDAGIRRGRAATSAGGSEAGAGNAGCPGADQPGTPGAQAAGEAATTGFGDQNENAGFGADEGGFGRSRNRSP